MIESKNLKKIKQLQNAFNTIVNFFWSLLALYPLTVFCYMYVERKSIWIYLGISMLPLFLPNSFLRAIQLSRTTRLYKNLGVHFIGKLAQNGYFINTWIRKKYPEYKVVTVTEKSVRKLLSQTYMFEKFHLLLFIFFMLTTIYALNKHFYKWAVMLTLINIFYNIYPNLLQQYIRVKLILFINRKLKKI